MKYFRALLIPCFLLSIVACNNSEKVEDKSADTGEVKAIVLDHDALTAQSEKESLIPVHPGVPGKSPFWNIKSTRFMHVPSFGFDEIAGAVKYRFTAFSEMDSLEYMFESARPWDTLAPIWLNIPVGYVDLTVEGLDNDGKVLATAGTRHFYKASSFRGPYHEPARDYNTSARLALKYLFDKSWLQNWISEGTPDKSYSLYCYPSKMIGSIIEGMILYGELTTANRDQAIQIARKAADYLIGVSEPEGAPLAYLPPTYDPEHIRPENMGENDSNWEYAQNAAVKYRGQIMLTYPPQVALSYLKLFDSTGDSAYFKAAVNIADSYARIQNDSGFWPLKVFIADGKPVVENSAEPTSILEMLRTLRDKYSQSGYDRTISLAEATVRENYQRFNFEGQFEDVEPSALYENLSHYPARNAVNYYLNLSGDRTENIARAEEYIRFAEDQFVVWEKPIPRPNIEEDWTWHSDQWITPCALEQYTCYVAIDASTTSFIPTYFSLYEATDDELYLAKAISLANSMTLAQNAETGMYPTWWASRDDSGWINCAISSAIKMYEFANKTSGKTILYE